MILLLTGKHIKVCILASINFYIGTESSLNRQVDHDESVNEDAFVWLATLVPLAADVVNGRFTFETFTAPTGHQLHFPAYDKFLKEIDK